MYYNVDQPYLYNCRSKIRYYKLVYNIKYTYVWVCPRKAQPEHGTGKS